MVVTSFMGTRRLYDFANDNPAVIAKHDNLVSINSTLKVDLMGEAYLEAIGPKQFSDVGGQVDFIRGAVWAKGGKPM